MTFSEKMQDLVNKGIAASKDFVSKAGEQAQVWGEMGALKVEIVQYQHQAEKLTASLGAEVYGAFVERGQKNLTADSPAIRELLSQIADLDKLITEKEARFKALGGKDADLEKEDRQE